MPNPRTAGKPTKTTPTITKSQKNVLHCVTPVPDRGVPLDTSCTGTQPPRTAKEGVQSTGDHGASAAKGFGCNTPKQARTAAHPQDSADLCLRADESPPKTSVLLHPGGNPPHCLTVPSAAATVLPRERGSRHTPIPVLQLACGRVQKLLQAGAPQLHGLRQMPLQQHLHHPRLLHSPQVSSWS